MAGYHFLITLDMMVPLIWHGNNNNGGLVEGFHGRLPWQAITSSIWHGNNNNGGLVEGFQSLVAIISMSS